MPCWVYWLPDKPSVIGQLALSLAMSFGECLVRTRHSHDAQYGASQRAGLYQTGEV